MLKTYLSNHGILGINARNLLYVRPFNPKKATAFADNKLKTKAFLSTRGIPAAKIYARIESRSQLHSFDFSQLPDECVLKPNYGFGGEGIMILKGRDKKGNFLKSGKEPISNDELIAHMEDVLDGKFSLGGRQDTPFFEQILVAHDCFAPFRPAGLPDLRLIIFNLVPVMAMLRIPTAESDGKANVHLGGIGIGIDIAKGVTTHGVQGSDIITELGHGVPVAGHQIPYWEEMLLVCSKIQYYTNIGYLAVDLTIDQQMGPALLEVNARAGLAVQLANMAPLRARLERVKGIPVSSPEKGVRLGQELFGEKVANVQASDDRPVLGIEETIEITGAGHSFQEPCIIAPDHERTEFPSELIEELLAKKAASPDKESDNLYKVKFTLGGKKLQTLVGVKERADAAHVTIGRRDLGGFLLDPSKKRSAPSQTSNVKTDLRAVDKLLAQIDQDVLLLKYIKPSNLEEERKRLEKDLYYNPLFQYRELEVDTEEHRRRLEEVRVDDSPLGVILGKKRDELLVRIDLLEARGKPEQFTAASQTLFGGPSSSLIRAAEAMIHNRESCCLEEPEADWLSAEAVQAAFEAVLEKYSLHNWTVAIRPKLVARCTVGGGNVYIRADARFPEADVQALIKHEIETHVLTAENGDHQPYAIFRRGTAGYLDTQEGLATYNQNAIYGLDHDKRYNAPRNVLALAYGLEHSFAETRAYMLEEIGYSEEKALQQAIAIKRGLANTADHGGFTKSMVYFRGVRAIEAFVADGGDLKRLYIGKITLEDLETIEQIPELQAPLLVPDFLR